MDARIYFELTDAIAIAETPQALAALGRVVGETDMHPLERRVLERVLRSRADTLRLGEHLVPRGTVERGD